MVMNFRQQRWFSLLIFLFAIMITNLQSFSEANKTLKRSKFKLIHRHDRQRNAGLDHLDRLKQSIHSDAARLRTISHKDGRKSNKENNVSGEMPMNSAVDYGTGQYFVQMKVGSPAQKFVLIADTGSDLTWINCLFRALREGAAMSSLISSRLRSAAQKFVLIADTGSDLTWINCKYRCRIGENCRRSTNKKRVFHADHSMSFRPVPCSSRRCSNELANLFSLTICPSPREPCAYDYRYADGSAALGLFANETVTFALTNKRKTRLRDVLIGCTTTTRGQSFQAADGLMGLGYSNSSFALKAANKFGGKFLYCLVDHLSPKNVSSYLVFGQNKKRTLTRYTELVLGVFIPFYAVNLRGISVGGVILDIPDELWNMNGQGGVILDSGSSLTSLAQPAYVPVMDALKVSVSGFRKLDLGIGPLEYCFNSTGFDESLVPKLVFQFGDGARFEPLVKSYVIDAAVNVKCLGFVAASWPGASVIGNIMQQNYFWEFDLKNRRLGFGRSSCT